MHYTLREEIKNFSFVLPALVIFFFFYILPFFYTFLLALHQGSGLSSLKFVGLENFRRLLSPAGVVILSGIVGSILVVVPLLRFWKERKFVPQGSRVKRTILRIIGIGSIGIGGVCIFYGFREFSEIFSSSAWIIDREWWTSVGRSFYITLWALTFQNFLAFALALCVDRAIRTGQIYRAIFFLLPVLSEIIIGLLVRSLLLPYPGVLVHFLERLGLKSWIRDWLNDPHYALTTLAITHCWRGFGWGFVILLAGLQTIPQTLYEAARIDGANGWQRFTKITLPLMLPVIVLVIILTILGTVQVIGLPMVLTRGGPAGRTTVSVLRIYNELKNYHAGYASSEGIILGIILVTLSFALLKISNKLKKI